MKSYRMSETAKEYFERHTYDLTEHDRHDLVLDYFDKIKMLLNQEVNILKVDVQNLNPTEKILINDKMKRIRSTKDVLADIDSVITKHKKGGGFR